MVNLKERQDIIKKFPCFATLTFEQSAELVALMSEVFYKTKENIVNENDLIDSIYLIVKGGAEVTRGVKVGKKMKQVPVAFLGTGEAIGLNDTGFYSTTGKRTATVVPVTDTLLLKLDLKDLYDFLKKNNLILSMYSASLQMLRIHFIKQSLPFAKLSYERLQWLADRVKEEQVSANTIIFSQGDEGDKCYLIRSGKVGIFTQDNNGNERMLASLQPPMLFGEATLITHTPRNATAIAQEDSSLLILSHKHLSELIESEANVAKMFMTLMVDRSRPKKNPKITMHERTTADGQELMILKNPDNNNYFKLSKEGAFIWQQLDGHHTMQEITLALAEQFKVFAPDMVAALISKLTQSNFITNLKIGNHDHSSSRSIWVRTVNFLRRFLEVRFAFGDADRWITKTYDKYVRYLFTKPGQIGLAMIAVVGLISFIVNTEDILLFFSLKHVNLLLLLGLIPFSLVAAMLHELGHAFAVKAFGREVHYIGAGWFWFTPIAYTDTSDMWLSSRKPRMLVNLAGIYVDILVAGISALLILIVSNPYIQGMLWLFALYTYIGSVRMMSPLQEMDGYYILMDWVEKNRLRQNSVLWLVKIFPQALREPKLFREYKPEIAYWIACAIYLICVTLVTVLVQTFVFTVLGINANLYISIILPFIVLLFSSLRIIIDIRNQTEE